MGVTVSLEDDQGVVRATRMADFKALLAVYEKPELPFEAPLAELAMDRVKFNLDESLRKSQVCLDAPEVRDEKGAVFSICSIYKAGNLLIQGDVSGWAKTMLEAKLAAYPRLRDVSGMPDLKVEEFEYPDYSKFIGFVRPDVKNKEGSYIINYVKPPDNLEGIQKLRGQPAPFVEIIFNNKKGIFLIDTASPAVVVTKDFAKEAGVTYPGGTGNYRVVDFAGNSNLATYGVAENIVFGGFSMRNWPVIVTNQGVNIIGLNVLSQLGNVTFNGESVLVDQSTKSPCGNGDILRVASDINGSRLVPVFEIKVDGAPVDAALDTGALGYNMIRKVSDLAELVGGGADTKSYGILGAIVVPESDAQDFAEIGNYRGNINYSISLVKNIDFRYYLGSGLLKNNKFYLGFKSKMACII